MKFEVIIMDIFAQLYILKKKKTISYTPGSGQTFILAHIDITVFVLFFFVVFFYIYILRFVHANQLQNEA